MFIAEALVIFACVNNAGCTETSNQYFLEHPDVKHYIDHEAMIARDYIGPKIVDTVGPVLFVVGGGTGIIHIHNHINLQLNKESGIIVLSWSL